MLLRNFIASCSDRAGRKQRMLVRRFCYGDWGRLPDNVPDVPTRLALDQVSEGSTAVSVHWGPFCGCPSCHSPTILGPEFWKLPYLTSRKPATRTHTMTPKHWARHGNNFDDFQRTPQRPRTRSSGTTAILMGRSE